MKKQILALTALLVASSALTGCETSGVADQKVVDALLTAQASVSLQGDLTSIYVDDAEASNEGNVEITFGNGFMDFNKTYNDVNGTPINYDYSFKKTSDGKIGYDRLTIQNTVETVKFKATYKELELDYDTYCLNPFSKLKATDFNLVEGRYYVKSNRVNVFNGLITLTTLQMYHFYEVEVASVSFSISDSILKDVVIRTVPRSDDLYIPSDFFYQDTFKLFYLNDVEPRVVSPKAHRDEHDVLKSGLNKMEEVIDGKNYTINVDEAESGGELSANYDVLNTETEFFSYFRPAIIPYVEGYRLTSDGKYTNYLYYMYSDINAGHAKGEAVWNKSNKSRYSLDRDEIECNFNAFAPEFFLKSGNSFVCTNSDVAQEIKNLISPFDVRFDLYYVASKIFFKFNEEMTEITSWGVVARDYLGGYEDTFEFTFKNIGSTSIPSFTIGE